MEPVQEEDLTAYDSDESQDSTKPFPPTPDKTQDIDVSEDDEEKEVAHESGKIISGRSLDRSRRR